MYGDDGMLRVMTNSAGGLLGQEICCNRRSIYLVLKTDSGSSMRVYLPPSYSRLSLSNYRQ